MASRVWWSVGAGAVLATAVLTTPDVALSSPRPGADRIETPAQPAAGVAEEATRRWLRRAYGLSEAQAARRLDREQQLVDRAARLTTRLGDRSGGAWLDERTGDLSVGVLDEAAGAAVRSAGARPVRVRHSADALHRVLRRLDDHATESGAGQATSWFVDVRRNVVVLQVVGGHSTAAEDALTRELVAAGTSAAGDAGALRIEAAPGRPAVHANIYGGRQIEGADERICTVGFVTTDSAGGHSIVTAGHCTEDTARMYSYGVLVGPVLGTSFPGNDYGAVAIDDRDAWTPRPWVENHDGYAVAVKGHSRAPVGSSVCKSGRTTKWTCGTIHAHDVTVDYGNGNRVSGLTLTSACSRGGDSGGSYLHGSYAQGTLSGGITRSGRCLEEHDEENVSYFQPIGEPLQRYGLQLLTVS
jgi:streptogrisin C